MRPVVEEIVSHGNKFNIGLEAGSKPELHAVLSIDIDDEAWSFVMDIKMKVI